MRNVFFFLTFFFAAHLHAQLPDGSTAPDFTLDDIVDSNTYNLYDYLNQGKTCFVEIFAAHCPGCWGYHQAETLKNLYNTYGPNGTDDVMVFALEYDQYNFYEAFIGIGPAWVTAGNWLDGTPYPIFQVEGGDRTVFDDYNVTFYPVVYMVCPDRSLKRVSTSLSATELYDGIADCDWLAIDEEVLSGKIYVDGNKNLIIENYQEITSIKVTNMQGQQVLTTNTVENEKVSLESLESGVYLFLIETESGAVVERFQVD